MLILGLGSNIGDRLDYLRKTLHALKNMPDLRILKCSPIYMSDAMLPNDAPANWNMSYLNVALRCETTMSPQHLLQTIKQVEKDMGRKSIDHWAPRVIDIDILAFDDLVIANQELNIPHPGLLERPFALWPLADVAPFWQYPVPGKNHHQTAAELVEPWASRFSGHAPFHTRQIYQRLASPQLVGIINVTPDSFSDGGKYIAQEAALQQAITFIEAGAEIIDIGAESTAPHAKPLMPNEEWQRLEPLLFALQQMKKKFLLPPKISIDTRNVAIAEKALQYDIDWINDVTGLQDIAMRQLVSASKKDCVVMHHLSIPASAHHVLSQHINVVKYIYEWAETHFAALEKQGISREKIIFDPGLGFGKTKEQSIELIQHIDHFTNLGTRILIGHSRKSFLTTFTDERASERDIETLACNLFLANEPVDYLRIHNVAFCARALRVYDGLRK